MRRPQVVLPTLLVHEQVAAAAPPPAGTEDARRRLQRARERRCHHQLHMHRISEIAQPAMPSFAHTGASSRHVNAQQAAFQHATAALLRNRLLREVNWHAASGCKGDACSSIDSCAQACVRYLADRQVVCGRAKPMQACCHILDETGSVRGSHLHIQQGLGCGNVPAQCLSLPPAELCEVCIFIGNANVVEACNASQDLSSSLTSTLHQAVYSEAASRVCFSRHCCRTYAVNTAV